jgi:pantothenate kinase
MAPEAISTAAPGSLAAIGTAVKAFALVHPVGLSIAGGALLGAGTYWGISRLLRKKGSDQPAAAAA